MVGHPRVQLVTDASFCVRQCYLELSQKLLKYRTSCTTNCQLLTLL